MQKQDEKLNKRERYKARLRPYDYFEEFETLDFENLGEGDRFYLQDFGIFNTDFLEDEFNIRLRVPAGRLSAEQFAYIADIVAEYELTLILTARGGIQIHEVEAENVLEIWKKFNDRGLSTWQSFGDNIRNIVTDVFDGVGKYSEIEVYPLILQMQEFILKNPRYVGMLPRRVSIGISGNSANLSSFFANDIYFALAKKGDIFGFNVYMGGKNTEVAQDIDIFLQECEVFDFFKAFVETFYLHGSRYTRSKTRLFYLMEDIGIEKLKSLLGQQYQKDFSSAGEIQLQHKEFDIDEKLKDGTYSFCYESDFGRLTPDEMQNIAHFASKESAHIRIGIDQNIYILGLKDRCTELISPKHSRSVLTCAGNLCPYAVWSIKNETAYLPLKKIKQHNIQVGFSGCAKGCGRHRHTDIGLIGLKTNHFGDTEGGARVFIGAEHSNGTSVARMLFSMVPFVHLNETLTILISMYEQSDYTIFELFAKNILNTYSEEFLSIWILANFHTKQTLTLSKHDKAPSFEEEKALLLKSFSKLPYQELITTDFTKIISALAKELWTVEGKDPNYKPPIQRTSFR